MSRATRLLVASLALASSLALVAWRQSRALEALEDLERARQSRALTEAELSALERHIQYLESRGRVVPEAREKLSMRTPQAREIVILPGEAP